MLNNYMRIFCLALCAYLFVNHLLHLFHAFTLPYCSCLDLSIPFGDKLPEVPAHGPGCDEFCFGQGSVLLEGHPSP
jgi:hypothetical protein